MYTPLRNHSHYSLTLSTSRCKQIAKKCAANGYTHAGLTDISTVSGCVNFIKECKKVGVTPIIGVDIFIRDHGYITLLCKNNDAWYNLLPIISISNDKKNLLPSKEPSIGMDDLASMINASDFVCIDGYVGSAFFNSCFLDMDCLFHAGNSEECFECLDDHSLYRAEQHTQEMKAIFPDYYLEINCEDSSDTFPVNSVISHMINSVDPDHSITIPNSSSYYPERHDSVDHRLLLCVNLKTTMSKLSSKIDEAKNFNLLKFIRTGNYHIKDYEKIKNSYSERLFENMDSLVAKIGELDILSNPKLPHFSCPNNMSEHDYLKSLCLDGFKKFIESKDITDTRLEIYKDRLDKELLVIENANLSGYFLIVQDYVNHFRSKGYLIGPARGSGAGSLVCYLTRITLIDPIEYDLLFERFYNEGRNTKDHVSLPDIDVDFPPDIRDDVIEYIKDKYGANRVCQMLTFGRLSGRSIIKEVLRANESCSYDQMNQITSKIPNEAAISDLLEEMDEPSVIRWALENDKNALIDYCWINDDGELEGEYAREFKQALRMEGIFKTQGKHAAGVVIASEPLEVVCPMVKAARTSEKIAGMEMGDLEAIGCVKFDILGVNILKKIASTVKQVNLREFNYYGCKSDV